MTLYDFMIMKHKGKIQTLKNGRFLALREDEDHQVILYKVNDFFVGVYYNLDSNAIERIRPFKTTWRLKAYFLNRMN